MSCNQCQRDNSYITSISLPSSISESILSGQDTEREDRGRRRPRPPIPPSRNSYSFQTTFNGARDLSPGSVTVRVVNGTNSAILQLQPFDFTLDTSNGFIEMNGTIEHIADHDIESPCRVRVDNNYVIGYTQIFAINRSSSRLRIFISSNPNFRANVGSRVSISGHSISWIKR